MQVNFDDLKKLAKALSYQLDLSKLISESTCQQVREDEKQGLKGFDIDTLEQSENMYNVLHLYIELLKEIYSNRPLPF